MRLSLPRAVIPPDWREPLLWAGVAAAAITAAWAVRGYLGEREAAAREALETRYKPRQVVVARTDLPPGTLLEAENLALRHMPADFLPSSAVAAEQAGQLRGRTLEHALVAGEPVQMALLKPLDRVHLAERVPLGRRAVTIAVDETSALAGLLQPGDRVDVHWVEETTRRTRGLENLEVLAVGDRLHAPGTGAESGRYSTVTLQVDLVQARQLAGAGHRVAVSLRNPRDAQQVEVVRNERVVATRPAVALIVGGHGGPVPAVHRLGEAR